MKIVVTQAYLRVTGTAEIGYIIEIRAKAPETLTPSGYSLTVKIFRPYNI